MALSWTNRVEAAKAYAFDADGNVSATHGRTLLDAVKLTLSADPIKQEAALQLIAAVLFKSMDGLQAQQQQTNSRKFTGPAAGADVDWQAVWTYAVGPRLELAASLRFSLDDANLSVVSACAKALHALLSCAANEAIFGLQESIWPGNKSAFTAPVFRRKTGVNEGFIGAGRYRYHVTAMDLYPATQVINPLSDTEEDRDAIGDEAAIASKDVAAGLLRMDVLSRIQYIFEKERLTTADENLLCVILALSRHSPAAAKCVMKCPRLMDSIIQRFLLCDEAMDATLRSAHTKAVQLLKILSQASAANCIRFAETGALQVAQSELYKQGFPMPTDPRIGEESFKGICATVVECLRLWRVCINHHIGIALFSDIYPTLCSWLAPLPCPEISMPSSTDKLLLAQESYSLLECLAWTLPVLPTKGEVHVNWAWATALPLVETASGWLSPDRIKAVCMELSNLVSEMEIHLSRTPKRCFRMKLVATLASVFHFLGTVCEMFSESDTVTVHPVVNHVATALACNNMLAFGTPRSGETLLEILMTLWRRADEETTMTVTSCIHGLVRLLNVVDQLQSGDGEVLSQGLVVSADGELRELLCFFGELVLDTKEFQLAGEVQPAPGLGLGWGQEGGGVWSRRGLHVKGIGRLVVELLEILPLQHVEAGEELMWRLDCCIRIAGVFGPGDGDIVYRMSSNVMLHPETLALVGRGVDRTLKAESGGIRKGSQHAPGSSSKLLLEHYLKMWLCSKPDKAASVRQGFNNKKLKTSLIATKLSNLSEETGKLVVEKVGMDGLVNDMVAEWAKQRLPLPPHYILSPMVMNLSKLVDSPDCKMEDGKFVINLDKQIAMADAIERGVAWLLGLEVLSQSLPDHNRHVFAAIPVARKLHSLSTLFLLGGDVFSRDSLKYCVAALQRLYGITSTADDLDFEGEVDAGYLTFLDALVTKFSSSSSSASPYSSPSSVDASSSSPSSVDANFARQVALYLRQDVSAPIRLHMWRALSLSDSFDLLPPLSDCIGGPSAYLSPSEKNFMIIDVFVTSWVSGALDENDSLAIELALHHVAALFFGQDPPPYEAWLRNTAKTILQMSNMELLQRFVEQPLSGDSVSSGEVQRRLSVLEALVEEGDEETLSRMKELEDTIVAAAAAA